MWESINESGHMGGSERMRIPGGWIVRSYLAINGTAGKAAVSIHQIFISDENHSWRI